MNAGDPKPEALPSVEYDITTVIGQAVNAARMVALQEAEAVCLAHASAWSKVDGGIGAASAAMTLAMSIAALRGAR